MATINPNATRIAHALLPHTPARLKLVLVLAISLLSLSLYLNSASLRPPNHFPFGHSAAFRSPAIPDPVTVPSRDNAQKLIPPSLPLKISLPPDTPLIGLSFLYQCESECPPIWLSYTLTDDNQTTITLPVHHPLIPENRWFHFIDQNLAIYQRTPTLTSLNQLLTQPATLALDPYLQNLLPLQPFHQTYSLDTLTNLDSIDYLVTTRLPKTSLHDWHAYQILLPAADISRPDPDHLPLTLTSNQTVYLTRLEAGYQ